MTIDQICQMTTNPTMLNALHACREGHPLNHANAFANAAFLAAQRPEINCAAFNWLNEQANKKRAEWENNTK